VIVPIAPGRTPLVVHSLGRLSGTHAYEVLTEVGTNPSRNRNTGVERARAAILAFTDDDCEVTPDWLARAAAFFAVHPGFDAVGGPQLTASGDGPIARAAGHALASRFGTCRLSRRFRQSRLRLGATQFDLSSANLFVTRRAFERWGPFDECLWPNEETALLRRIEAAGGRIAYDPSIVVRHKRRDTLRGFARQCFGYGRGRARQSRLERSGEPTIEQTIPAVFLLYLLLLPLLASWSTAAWVPLAAWIAAAGVVSARVARADPRAALVLPAALLALHVAYPAGIACEALLARRRGAARAEPPLTAADGTVGVPS
jgi:GT2 family glycosyltransferase